MPTARAQYTGPSKAAIAKILNGQQIRGALRSQVERGRLFAESEAETFTDTGDYAAKFVTDEGTIVIDEIERPTGVLRNTAGHAASVEWGHHGTATAPGPKAHHTLAHTLEYLRQP